VNLGQQEKIHLLVIEMNEYRYSYISFMEWLELGKKYLKHFLLILSFSVINLRPFIL